MSKKIDPIKRIEGEIRLPGDKSISHRSVIIGSIAKGMTIINNFLQAEDCIATMGAFKKMGVTIRTESGILVVEGVGLKGLKSPSSDIYLGNSGTSMRLLLGILAGQGFKCTLTGDESLITRPMKRVTVPLRLMGADIRGKEGANFAPLTIAGGRLKAIDHHSPVASAQVKSSIIFAGLYADGITSVSEPSVSRDHTERMLAFFGADIATEKLKVRINGPGDIASETKNRTIHIPGDISSGAFFIVAALLLKGSKLVIRDIGFNKTRTGIIDILKRMGGLIEVRNMRDSWEPVCDLVIHSSELKATNISGPEIPRAIDELPALMVASAFAKGRTVIRGAGELRVKETDRIASMIGNLSEMGLDISCQADDIYIEGGRPLSGSASLKSFGDHRTAMAIAIAGLCSGDDSSVIDDIRCVDTSFPGFFDILESVSVH